MNHYDHLDPGFADPLAGTAAAAPGVSMGLRDVLAAMRRHAWPLATWVVLCLGLAAYYGITSPPEYTAVAEVLLEARRPLPGGADGSAGAVPAALDNAQAESQTHVIGSERVLQSVFDALDVAGTPLSQPQAPRGLKAQVAAVLADVAGPGASDPALGARDARRLAFAQFSNQVGVKRIGQSYVFEVSFKADSPDLAARTANAVATAYLRDQVNNRVGGGGQGVDYLQGRVALVKAELDAADAAIRAGTVPAIPLPDADARIISAALPPLAPSAPRRLLLLALGGAAGLLTGLGAILLLQVLDRSLHTPAQVWSALHLDCLAAIPAHRRPRLDGVVSEPTSDFAGSVRAARAALLAKLPRSKPAAVGLLACGDGAGVTTLVAGLGHVLAVSGTAVVLVDADLRKPSLSRALAVPGADALDRLLARGAPGRPLRLAAVSQDVDLLPAADPDAISEPNLFLGSAAMAGVIAGLRQERTVIVDLPPLTRSSDGLAVGPLLDGVVLVAEAGRTAAEDLAAAARALQGTGTTVLGVLLNKAALAEW